jgi:hypothetical protein
MLRDNDFNDLGALLCNNFEVSSDLAMLESVREPQDAK